MVDGRFLLDTSTIIWSLVSPERLPATVRRALKGHLVLSVVNYWEVVIKSGKGLLSVGNPVDWWSRTTEALGGTILSVRAAHVSLLSGLPDIHKDPFDRILVAQAAAEGLTLVTNDPHIRQYPVNTLW